MSLIRFPNCTGEGGKKKFSSFEKLHKQIETKRVVKIPVLLFAVI
jgi:hypothetical protein